jgi:hypothetical protein
MKPFPAASLLSISLLSLSPCHAQRFQKRALVAPASFDNGWTYQGCYMYGVFLLLLANLSLHMLIRATVMLDGPLVQRRLLMMP